MKISKLLILCLVVAGFSSHLYAAECRAVADSKSKQVQDDSTVYGSDDDQTSSKAGSLEDGSQPVPVPTQPIPIPVHPPAPVPIK